MVKKIAFALLLLIAFWLVSHTPVSAKGAPDKVTISGPGIDGEIEVTDVLLLEVFGFYRFNDMGNKVSKPIMVGDGYVITRFISHEDRMIAWDKVTYYHSQDGDNGVLFFNGLLQGMSTEGQGYWYLATEEGDKIMERILAQKRRIASWGYGEVPAMTILLDTKGERCLR